MINADKGILGSPITHPIPPHSGDAPSDLTQRDEDFQWTIECYHWILHDSWYLIVIKNAIKNAQF